MSTQGQGDVASRANIMADMLTAGDRIRYGDDAALLRELAAEITRLRTLLSSSRGEQGINAAEIAQNVAVRVAGLSDRTSPDDWPEAMLVTSEELHLIVMSEIHEALYDAKSAPGSVPTSIAGQGTDGTEGDADLCDDCGSALGPGEGGEPNRCDACNVTRREIDRPVTDPTEGDADA